MPMQPCQIGAWGACRLKPGDGRWQTIIEGLRIFSSGELAALLTEAGFSRIAVDHELKRHWLCVLAVREPRTPGGTQAQG